MSVQSVTGVPSTGNAQPLQGNRAVLDGDVFMKMLMAQLTHQNPLEPLKDAEMMSQFTQLNSAQELQSMRVLLDQMVSANRIGYAASLIGKTVRLNREDGTLLEGVVTGVNVEKNKVYVQIGSEKAPLDQVVEIKGK